MKNKTFKNHVLEKMDKYPRVKDYLDNNGLEYEDTINGLEVFKGSTFITLCKKDDVNSIKNSIKNSTKNKPTNEKYMEFHDEDF